MQWNRIFRENEIFCHPNIYVELGKTETPLFLETIPEVKLESSKFARNNVNGLSCDVITWRWIKSTGFSYCEREKNYLTDKHKDKSNCECRNKFIKQYFQYEKILTNGSIYMRNMQSNWRKIVRYNY